MRALVPIAVVFALVWFPVYGEGAPAASAEFDAVDLRVTPEGFGNGRSLLLDDEPGSITRDEWYEKLLRDELAAVGVDVEPGADVVLTTWVFVDRAAEAVVRLQTRAGDDVRSGVLVRKRGGTVREILTALAPAVASAVSHARTGSGELRGGVDHFSVNDLVEELPSWNRDRHDRAVGRLGRLGDPAGLSQLREQVDATRPSRRTYGEIAALEPQESWIVAKWHHNRGLAALQRGEFREAEGRFRNAIEADADDKDAHLALAELMLRSDYAGRDVESAVEHLRQAAFRRQADACDLLGFLYSAGDGIPRDLVEATMWYGLAAEFGHEGAAASRDALKDQLTPEQRASIESRIEDAVSRQASRGPLIPGVGGVTLPLLLKDSKVPPTYPIGAREARIRGHVILETIIRADGSVDEIRVLDAWPRGHFFEGAAIEAVRQWRYEPATLRGEPVDVWMTINVGFSVH